MQIDKQTLVQWLKDIEELKKDKELLLSDYEGLLKDKRKLEEENDTLKNNAMEDMRELTELEEENKELKKKLEKYKHYYDRDKEDLTEELDYWKKEAKRLGWKPNLMEEDTIQELKDIGEF